VGISGNYGIQLSPEEDSPIVLSTPIHGFLQRLSEKVVDQEETDATITSISLKSAVFSCASDLAPWEDVRCTLLSHQGLGVVGEVYGKVTSVEPLDAGSRVTVRFTSLSDDAEKFIRKLCGSAEAKSQFSVNQGAWAL
jgi:hypothetical protein